MSCYCDYDGSWSLYHEHKRKARKVHRCGECGRAVMPGETYQVAAGLYDGEFSHHKRCSHCVGLAEWLKAHVPCFCDSWGGLFEDGADIVAHYAHETIGLYVGFHRRWRRLSRLPKYVDVIKAQKEQ